MTDRQGRVDPTPSTPQEEETDGAGLIHQAIPDVEGTEPRPNEDEYDWRHGLTVGEIERARGQHISHCYQGEESGCKYGNSNCPAEHVLAPAVGMDYVIGELSRMADNSAIQGHSRDQAALVNAINMLSGGNQATTQSSGDDHGSAAQKQHSISLPEITRERVIMAACRGFAEAFQSLPRDGSFDVKCDRAKVLAAAREALIIALERGTRSDHPIDMWEIVKRLLASLPSPAQEQTDAIPDRRQDHHRDQHPEPLAVSDRVVDTQAVSEIQALLKEWDVEGNPSKYANPGQWAVAMLVTGNALSAALRASATAQQQDRALLQCQGAYIKAAETERDFYKARAEQAEQAREALRGTLARILNRETLEGLRAAQHHGDSKTAWEIVQGLIDVLGAASPGTTQDEK